MRHLSTTQRSGFSLVELSIVLVILGLLTGGILTGQSLIRAAELRSLIREFNSYPTAMITFRDKYFYLPGDLPNATDFWGAATVCPGDETTTPSTGTETCNGDGSGFLGHKTSSANDNNKENHRFWQHLVNAGLIEGNYTGLMCHPNIQAICFGENAPASALGRAGWSITYTSQGAGHMFHFGAETGNQINRIAVLSPEEAWNIDRKMDDGMPMIGSVRTLGTDAPNNASVLECATGPATDVTTQYNLSQSGIHCVLQFIGSI